MTRAIGILMALLFLTVLPAVGQHSLDDVLARLRNGQIVRLTASDGERRLGIVSRSGETVRIMEQNSTVPFAAATIDSLWTRQRRTGTGALIGGVTFGVAGLFAIPAIAGAVYGEGADATLDDQAILGALAAAAVGAVLGGVIGRAFSKWNLVYRAS